MFRQRSRVSLTRPDEHRLVIQSNTARRVLFGSIAALLIVSFLVSTDWDGQLADGMIAGTIFYFAVVLVCLGVAGWNSRLVLDHEDEQAHFIRRFFGITLGHGTLAHSQIHAVVIQGLKFLRENEQPQSGLISSRFRSYMERRNVYYKLHLETEQKLHFVEDSTDIADLESAAQQMADFLGVTYRREEI